MCAQIYREKLKADVEGRPFTVPPPSTVQVNLPRNSSPAAPADSRGKMDEWGDWSNGTTGNVQPSNDNSGFSSNSEYTRSQLLASAANKDEFFQRRMQVMIAGSAK